MLGVHAEAGLGVGVAGHAAVLADHVLEVEVALAGVELPLVHELHRGHLGAACGAVCLKVHGSKEGWGSFFFNLSVHVAFSSKLRAHLQEFSMLSSKRYGIL